MLFNDGLVEFKITFTTRCSARCTTCLNCQIEKHYDIDEDLFKKIIYQIVELDISNPVLVSFFSIGETYLHKNCVELCEWAIPILHEQGIRTRIVTNGSNVTRLPKGIDDFYISFNAGKKETYEKITNLDYESVVANIKDLYRRGEFSDVNDAEILMLCFDENEKEEQDFLDTFKELSGVKYRFSYKYDNQYGKTAHAGQEIQYQLDTGRIPCNYVTNKVVIYPNGDVVRCSHDFFCEYVYGNLYNNSMLEILNCDERIKLIEEHCNKEFSGICECCDYNAEERETDFIEGYFDKDLDAIFRNKKNDYEFQLHKFLDTGLFSNVEKIMLWGKGKRGDAFIKWAKEKRINVKYSYDKKEGIELIELEKMIFDSEIIVASNHEIYNILTTRYSDQKGKVLDLEKYCPY